MPFNVVKFVSNNEDIPQIAKFLFNIYPTDALEFEALVPKKVIDLMPQIFPNSNPAEIDRMTQILKIQTLTKFCHISENLGATALAFKSMYGDFREEILGLFNTTFNYQVAQVRKFYQEIKEKDNDYIAMIYGHPSIILQEEESKKLIEMSCRNIRKNFDEIGELFVRLEPLYNAYKHGYRLLLGKEDEKGIHIVVFVTKVTWLFAYVVCFDGSIPKQKNQTKKVEGSLDEQETNDSLHLLAFEIFCFRDRD
jgi:hypothetical protein